MAFGTTAWIGGKQGSDANADWSRGRASYDRALRHSRRVRLLRRFLPLLSIAVVVAPFFVSWLKPLTSGAPDVKVGAVSVSGTKVTMEAPRLSGFKKDNKAYEMTAKQAVQDLKAPSVIELIELQARMEQERNSHARLTAKWGRYDQTADKLDLKGSVRVRTDTGYEADMESAQVQMKLGTVVSNEPVQVRSRTGTISADRMEILDSGKQIVFEGRVRSLFITDDQTAAPGGGAKP
jgi:lipopolysaccharide export system protein LptC